MMPSMLLRDRAERCRVIARDYSHSVAAPLYEKAAALEQEADRIERHLMFVEYTRSHPERTSRFPASAL